ncbi:MAG TPA: hypothetical protein VGX00_02420 [Thermoplasmata archaeon]|nr:hypothetical protein [Thermoplasmata archaeon]
MSESIGPPPGGEDDRATAIVLYDRSVALPLIVGAAAIVAGGLLILAEGHRSEALDLAFLLAVTFIVGGAIAYFAIGMWLVPASMILAGFVLFAANRSLLYLPGASATLAVVYLILGTLTAGWGALRSHRTPARPAFDP